MIRNLPGEQCTRTAGVLPLDEWKLVVGNMYDSDRFYTRLGLHAVDCLVSWRMHLVLCGQKMIVGRFS